jgi:hypothetical protein
MKNKKVCKSDKIKKLELVVQKLGKVKEIDIVLENKRIVLRKDGGRNIYQNEPVQPCFVCGARYQRYQTDKYFYFKDILVCQTHPGAREWYHGALKMLEYALKSLEP